MNNCENMFRWMVKTQANLELRSSELFKDCLNEKIGQFIHLFGQDFTESLLDLSDAELNELYPQRKCPLSYDERQDLRRMLSNHVLRCSACFESELREEARVIITERAIKQNGHILRETFNFSATN